MRREEQVAQAIAGDKRDSRHWEQRPVRGRTFPARRSTRKYAGV